MKIDREKLIELLTDSTVYVMSKKPLSQSLTEQIIEEKADFLISKGVTIPVRCGECIYMEEAYEKNGFLICPASGMEIMNTDFCSYGERKEDVTDTKDGKYSEKPNGWKDRMLRTFLGRDR